MGRKQFAPNPANPYIGAPENAEGLIIMLEVAAVVAVTVAVMALLYRWLEPKT
jgi:hypothetical protein